MIGDNGQLFGWADSTWLWLDQAGILVGDLLMLITIGGSLLAFFKRDRIRQWLRGNRFPHIGSELEKVAGRWDGLAFTVSREEVPLWVMGQVKPRAIALVATRESLAAADALIREAEKQRIVVHGPYVVEDADDPAQSREQALQALRRLRQEGCERLAMDITGGRVPMSIGAFMAAEETGIPTLYVSATYDRKLNRPNMARAAVRCISRPESQ